MLKYLDFIVLILSIFIITFLIVSIFIKNIWINIVISTLITFTICLILSKIKSKLHGKITYTIFAKQSIIRGNSYLLGLINKFFRTNYSITDNYIELKNNEMLFASIKYGNISSDEIIKYYNIAKDKGIQKFYLTCHKIDRNVTLVANNLDIAFTYIPLRLIYKIAKKANLIDSIVSTEKQKKKSITAKVFNVIFSPVNAKRFFFVGGLLLLLSLFIPFKTYYRVLGGINITLALLCLINKNHHLDYGRYGIFNELLNRRKKSLITMTSQSTEDISTDTPLKNIVDESNIDTNLDNSNIDDETPT